MSSGIDIALEDLKSQLNNAKMDLSQARKAGFDTKIAEMFIMGLPAKIQLAEATKDNRDIQIATKLMEKIKGEIEESKQKKKDDVNFLLDHAKEAAGERIAQQETIEEVQDYVGRAYEAISKQDRLRAMRNYHRIREMYKFLPIDARKKVYSQTLDIYNKIVQTSPKPKKQPVKEKATTQQQKKSIFKRLLFFR